MNPDNEENHSVRNNLQIRRKAFRSFSIPKDKKNYKIKRTVGKQIFRDNNDDTCWEDNEGESWEDDEGESWESLSVSPEDGSIEHMRDIDYDSFIVHNPLLEEPSFLKSFYLNDSRAEKDFQPATTSTPGRKSLIEKYNDQEVSDTLFPNSVSRGSLVLEKELEPVEASTKKYENRFFKSKNISSSASQLQALNKVEPTRDSTTKKLPKHTSIKHQVYFEPGDILLTANQNPDVSDRFEINFLPALSSTPNRKNHILPKNSCHQAGETQIQNADPFDFEKELELLQASTPSKKSRKRSTKSKSLPRQRKQVSKKCEPTQDSTTKKLPKRSSIKEQVNCEPSDILITENQNPDVSGTFEINFSPALSSTPNRKNHISPKKSCQQADETQIHNADLIDIETDLEREFELLQASTPSNKFRKRSTKPKSLSRQRKQEDVDERNSELEDLASIANQPECDIPSKTQTNRKRNSTKYKSARTRKSLGYRSVKKTVKQHLEDLKSLPICCLTTLKCNFPN